jgi:dTDP-3-amino-3,6-dideoxy-alpha-D-glucopyranose N,N-dimethyltransferase/dTDP-3-amino-3,4,6-trideoxy-alpha-D-glucopyranose N,N-dimethyltransferase/N-methyltransferase
MTERTKTDSSVKSSHDSYGAFAYAYDQSLGQSFFSAVRRVLDDVLYKYPSRAKTLLDVACGTGLALEHLGKHGFRSIGVDASLSMLSIARRRSARLIACDLRALPLRRKFARITCLYDSLNHMLTRDDLVAAFASLRGVMDAGSLLLFDMNHPDIYPAVWGMRDPYVSSGKHHHLEIATTYRRRARRGYGRVTGWATLPDGERVKICESHEQFAWNRAEIEEALAAARLSVVEVIDFDPFEEIGELKTRGVKMFFVCRVLK